MEGTQRMEHVAGWIRALVRCGIGGAAYYVLELTWRGHSHWTMAVLGGILFVLLGDIDRRLGGNVPLWAQGMLGAALVTEAELSAGIWLNLIWRLDIWDYSRVPLDLPALYAPLAAGVHAGDPSGRLAAPAAFPGERPFPPSHVGAGRILRGKFTEHSRASFLPRGWKDSIITKLKAPAPPAARPAGRPSGGPGRLCPSAGKGRGCKWNN